MKRQIVSLAFLGILLSSAPATAATGSDLVVATQKFVSTGISNAETTFSSLRGAPIKAPSGQHFEVNTSFGDFLPTCHVSAYEPPLTRHSMYVLSCSTPGLKSANANQVRSIIYEGVVRALPACFSRTLNPGVLRDETYRWDCPKSDHSMSVDVSTEPTSNADPSFLLEVYDYAQPPMPPSPTPTPGPVQINMQVANANNAVDMAGVSVPYPDYMTLNLGVHAASIIGKPVPGVPHVIEVLKGGNEMPPYDWLWHYVGKTVKNGAPEITVWVCTNLSPDEQAAALTQASLFGLLDAGLGGPVLQKAYTTARVADEAQASSTDPIANRRQLIYAMYRYFR